MILISERKRGVKTFFDAVVANWWGIFLFIFSGAASGLALLRRWNRRNEVRHSSLEQRQNDFESKLDEALKASTARHNDEVASCDRCRADVMERIARADSWVREDSAHQWAALNNLIQKIETVAQCVARIEGLLEARRLDDRKPYG